MCLPIAALISALLLVNPPPAPEEPDSIAARLQAVYAGAVESPAVLHLLAVKDYAGLSARLHQQAALAGSNQAELTALQGDVAFLGGRFSEAVSQFASSSALAPLRDTDAFTFAMALIKLGDSIRSAALLSNLARRHPQQPLYPYWLGRIAYGLRRYPQAIQHLQAAVQLEPKSARAWNSLGLAFDMQGNGERAQNALLEAAGLNRALPHPSPWPPHDLGYWLLRADRLAEAEQLLREALSYDLHHAQAHYHLARTLEKEGRAEQAVSEYQSAMTDDPAAADACYSLALLYRKLHREEEASRMFAQYRATKKETP